MTVLIKRVRNGWIVNLDADNEFMNDSCTGEYIFKTSKEMYEWLPDHVGD